ncbi:MAG: hypothetical protein PHU79_00965 [Oscillospiraceae bacterium]|nr:hypothetical protein [Oscillospiraceae bacterium]
MKILELAVARIVLHFRRNKVIFLLFLIGSVTCVLSFAYFYGNMLSVKLLETRTAQNYRQYTVTLPQATAVTEKTLVPLEPYGVEDFRLESKLRDTFPVNQEERSYDNQDMRKDTQSSAVWIEADGKQNTPLFAIAGHTDFPDKGGNSVIMPKTYAGNPGDTVQLLGQNFLVIGLSTRTNQCVIPFTVYKQLGISTNKMELILNKKLNGAETAAVVALLQKMFPQAQVTSPKAYQALAKSAQPGETLRAAMLYAVSLLAFLFLFKFMSDQNRFENVLYAMVGATRKQVKKVLLAENILLSLLSGTIGLTLHASLYSTVFVKLNPLGAVPYTLGDYGLLLFLILAVSLFTAIPFLVQFQHTALVDAKVRFRE